MSRLSPIPASRSSYLAGAWCPVDPGRLVRRENPARPEETAATWCPATGEEARRAFDAAATAAPTWAATPLSARADLLTQLLNAVDARTDEFVALIIHENGKTRRDARVEVASGLADARHAIAAALAQGLSEPVSTANAPVHSELVLEPVGPCLLVTPWNFPLATILRKLVPALLYGNTAVVKPSELTPGPACRLFALLAELPLPAGVASLVLGPGAELGPVLAQHPALRAISLTGSTGAGAALARLAAGRDVRLQLEMGGKNSLVVLADADLDAAVEAAITGGFSCTGQWCTGTGRVIVDQSIHTEFMARLAARAARLRAGPGDDDRSDLGPLVSAARLAFAQSALAAAIAAGARVRCEGHPLPGGYFFAPTVLDGVTETMPVFTDELFVPILPVIAARDEADAVRLANAGHYGLSASIFSRDTARAMVRARELAAGIVHVNLHTAYREPALPVSAWRESGRGLPEGGRFSRDFFTRPRAMYLRRP